MTTPVGDPAFKKCVDEVKEVHAKYDKLYDESLKVTPAKNSPSEILIPQQLILAGAKFNLVTRHGKDAFERDWNLNTYDPTSPRLTEHLKNGGNYGVVSHNNICCIDLDYPEIFKKLNVTLPASFMVTRNNGETGHYYFICNDAPDEMKTKFEFDFGDIRLGGNFYTVGPTCIAPSKKEPTKLLTYDIIQAHPLAVIPYSTIEQIMQFRKNPQSSTGKKEVFVMPVKADQRHYMFRSLVGSMVTRGNTFQAIMAACQAENTATCDPPKTKEFVEKEVTSLYEWAVKKKEQHAEEKQKKLDEKTKARELAISQGTLTLDDCGNAIRFCKAYGNMVRHCEEWGKWFIWDGLRWKEDNTNLIYYYAKKVAKSIYVEASLDNDNSRSMDLSKWAHESSNNSRINAMVESATSEHDFNIPITFDVLDQDPYLINLNNGTFDLRTFEMLPHDQANMITKMANVDYNPEAQCPQWLAFLDRIFKSQDEKKHLISFLQRACGYSMTGDTKEQVMFFLYGSGANGKSTFIDVIQHIMGDYGAATESSTFTTAKADSIRNDIARLVGQRFVSASENSTESLLDESLVKKLTGNEKISARFLHKEYFEFYPQFKIWWAFNHQPYIRDNTNSIWRRIMLIPFEERIPDSEQDKELAIKLKQEAPGIFNWMVHGLLEYNLIGLNAPEKIRISTKEYRDDQDILFDFIKEACVVSENQSLDLKSDIRVSASKLYNAYVEWAGFNRMKREDTLSATKFGKILLERGFQRDRTSAGKVYVGIRLR